ncbi:tubulin-folding cofactor B, partial [Brachionus plicatilis]
MVNYDSITLGLRVQFMKDEKICSGTVRYKGGVNGKKGVFIGIEADESVGYCDGRMLGRVYFKCADKYGLFLNANEIRLVPHLKRKRKCTLHKSLKSECDELLFRSTCPEEKVNSITENYLHKAKSCFGLSYDNIFANQPRYNRNNYLVYCPKSSASEGDSKKSNGFQHQSSIQRAFMPKEEMKLYTSVNWSYKNVHLPKNTDLNNTFE